jgi:2,3-bisphosphoglycerate-independent phosphoglycerate mutase
MVHSNVFIVLCMQIAMKYLLLIPDGMADWEIEKLGRKTPLEVADTPNMDFLAKKGACGMAETIPKGFEPGSDIANLTILGVDVERHYTGRGPIEALARGIDGKYIFRCNLVYIEKGIMKDYSAQRIGDEEAKRVINSLNKEVEYDFVRFYVGRSYRNLLVLNKDFDDEVKTTPPHDIQGRLIADYLPKGGELALLLAELMEWSSKVVSSITDRANGVWIWGGGRKPNFPRFQLSGLMISEVDLVRGIGKGLGFEVMDVKGTTGYIDTNYKGLAKAALRGLKEKEFVVLHTEGIDEVSHEGDAEKKVEGIELYDEKVVGYILDRIDEEIRIMLLPDHPTPIEVRTHVAEPVPFAFYGSKKDEVKVYSEKSCRKGRFGLLGGLKLIDLFRH